MRIGVPREIKPEESRVALTPSGVAAPEAADACCASNRSFSIIAAVKPA